MLGKRCEVISVWSGSLTSSKSNVSIGEVFLHNWELYFLTIKKYISTNTNRQSYFLEIQRYYWRRGGKDGEEKVGNELCLLQPLLLPLPLIENYIFLHNWETHFHTIEKYISAQLTNIFLHREIYFCYLRNILLHNREIYNV